MGLGFWIGVVVGILLLFGLTFVGAAFSRRARLDDWSESQDRPLIPGPPAGWIDDGH